MPEADTFGDDGTRNRFILRIHIAGKVAERIQCGLITNLITQEREEGIDILCLVVSPDSCIIGFTTGTMHQSTFRAVDAFSATQFGESKHAIEHGIGCVQNQIAPPLTDKRFTRGTFTKDIDVRKAGIVSSGRGIRQFPSGKDCIELKRLSRFQNKDTTFGKSGFNAISTIYTGFPRSSICYVPLRHSQRYLIRTAILESIFLTIARSIGRGIEYTRQLHGIFQFLTPVNITETTFHTHNAIEGNIAYFFIQQGLIVHCHQSGNIHIETLLQIVLCLIGMHAKHRENKTSVQVETLLCIHAVTKDNGKLLTTHFQMIVMWNIIIDIPANGSIILNSPTIFRLCNGQRTGKDEREK